jgi:hypothetical protein
MKREQIGFINLFSGWRRVNIQRDRKSRLGFTSALTPALCPKERESQLPSLVNLAAVVAVVALLLIAPKSRPKQRVFLSPKPGRRFTISSGERAGVRASVHHTLL